MFLFSTTKELLHNHSSPITIITNLVMLAVNYEKCHDTSVYAPLKIECHLIFTETVSELKMTN